MRIKFVENKKETIMNVGIVKKLYDYSTFGNCLYSDGYVFVVGDKLDNLFETLLKNGYVDLTEYKYFEAGI